MIFRMSATRYSRALYEVAKDSGELERVKADMQFVDSIFSKLPELKAFLSKNETTLQDARKSIEIVFAKSLNKKTLDTFGIMVRNGRISSLPFMPLAFSKVCEKNGEGLNIVVEFVNNPSDKMIASIKQNIEKRVGKIATLKIKRVPSILAGFRVKWSNKIMDNSAIGRIRELSQRLLAS